MFGGTKPTFGAAPTTTGFGAFNNTATSSPFGAFTKPATSAFGAAPSFGAQQTTPSMFGSSTAQPQTSGLFGGASTSTAFGSTTTTQPAFGTFSQPQQNTSIFGAAQPQANSSSLFGQPTTTSAFGSAVKPPGLGTFGQTGAQTSTSLFGQPAASTSTSGFGSFGQTAPTTTSVFGSTTASAFGQPANAAAAANPGTSIAKYQPTIGTDTLMKGGQPNSVNTKQHCITAMKEYEGKSLEELRMEDYLANRKGPQSGATGGFGGFGSATQPTAGTALFGATAQQSTGLFGQTAPGATENKGLFGSTTSAFGQPTTGGFGATATQPFGAKPFGATATTGFGTTAPDASNPFGAKPAFGETEQKSSTFIFCQSAASNSTSSFGSFGLTNSATTNAFDTVTASSSKQPTNTVTSGTYMAKYQETDGQENSVQTKQHCITAMKEYEGKSFEELRMEDYAVNCEGPKKNNAGSLGLFGTKIQSDTGSATADFTNPLENALNFEGNERKPESLSTFGISRNYEAQLSTFAQTAASSSGKNFVSFGQTSPSFTGASAFNQPVNSAASLGSSIAKYQPTISVDTVMSEGNLKSVNTKQHNISSMKEYEGKSFEELRMEDYEANRKGVVSCNAERSDKIILKLQSLPSAKIPNTTVSWRNGIGAHRISNSNVKPSNAFKSLELKKNKTAVYNFSQLQQNTSNMHLKQSSSLIRQPTCISAFSSDSKPSGFASNSIGGFECFRSTVPTFTNMLSVGSNFTFKQAENPGTSVAKYKPTLNIEINKTSGQDIWQDTKMYNITLMKEYEAKSLEELRMEDYLATRKGIQRSLRGIKSTAGTILFGTNDQRQTGLYSQPTTYSSQNRCMLGLTRTKPLSSGAGSEARFDEPERSDSYKSATKNLNEEKLTTSFVTGNPFGVTGFKNFNACVDVDSNINFNLNLSGTPSSGPFASNTSTSAPFKFNTDTGLMSNFKKSASDLDNQNKGKTYQQQSSSIHQQILSKITSPYGDNPLFKDLKFNERNDPKCKTNFSTQKGNRGNTNNYEQQYKNPPNIIKAKPLVSAVIQRSLFEGLENFHDSFTLKRKTDKTNCETTSGPQNESKTNLNTPQRLFTALISSNNIEGMRNDSLYKETLSATSGTQSPAQISNELNYQNDKIDYGKKSSPQVDKKSNLSTPQILSTSSISSSYIELDMSKDSLSDEILTTTSGIQSPPQNCNEFPMYAANELLTSSINFNRRESSLHPKKLEKGEQQNQNTRTEAASLHNGIATEPSDDVQEKSILVLMFELNPFT